MQFRDIAKGEPWMTLGERRRTRKFIAALKRLFSGCGVEETPLLVLRVEDVAIHYLLVRRIEEGLAPASDNAEGAVSGCSGALADQIGKSRERLRKAIRELEDACARLGRPIDVGIADQLLPLVRQTGDLLHNAELATPENGDKSPDSGRTAC